MFDIASRNIEAVAALATLFLIVNDYDDDDAELITNTACAATEEWYKKQGTALDWDNDKICPEALKYAFDQLNAIHLTTLTLGALGLC